MARGQVSDVEERVGVAPNYIKAELFTGRRKRKLGDVVGISQFGVNYTMLEPGAYSALRHWHEGEDEFIYVLEGQLTLIDDDGEHVLGPGNFSGFPAGDSNAHHVMNAGDTPAVFLEVGSRRPGEDTVHYPDDDFGPIER
ncbi:MAG: cupin domain-containing protein [Pseudomonadales bacterium]